jgi:hypothetical protein
VIPCGSVFFALGLRRLFHRNGELMCKEKNENKSDIHQMDKRNGGEASYADVLKMKYLKYEEFGFLKIKSIRFSLIFSLLLFSIFWHGAETPDFENAPRYVTVGRYHCPLVGGRGYGNAEMDGVKYFHDWSKLFGFWHRSGSCQNSYHNKIIIIEWIAFRDKRVITAITEPTTGQPIAGYARQLEYLKGNAASVAGVYVWRLVALLLALFLLAKTDWKDKGSKS